MPDTGTTATVSPNILESRIAEAEAATGLDETARNDLLELYGNALSNLRAAASNEEAEETIMIFRKVIVALLFTGLALVWLPGCDKSEGPAEKAGKAIDKAASDISEGASQKMEAIEKKVKE